jgi:hypothetical protein
MFKNIFNISGKKEPMNNQEIEKPTQKSVNDLISEYSSQDFQWIKGDNAGDIEAFDSIQQDNVGNTYVCFKSGQRINTNLLEEFMISFVKTGVNFSGPNTPAGPVMMPEDIQAVRKTTPKINSINYETGDYKYRTEDTAIHKLLRKQKPNWVDINISIKLNLPTKELYSVLITSFEEAEDEIAEYVVEGVEIEDIKKAISDSIKNTFYGGEKKPKTKTIKNIIEDDEI